MFLQPRPVPMILKDDFPMLEQCHYYWEIKLSHLQYRYSSDGWFGIGLSNVSQIDATNLIQHNVSKENFWGYGNNGTIAHNNETTQYGPHFHEGDTLGAHLDLYHGTLEFHRNRKPLGIAYSGLNEKLPLYPVLIGATAIPMPNKIDGPYVFTSSLQLMCYRKLAQRMSKEDILKIVPPGLVSLVHSFEFLHYFTGEPPKPERYTRTYEMVIVSEEEEENVDIFARARSRRRLRQQPTPTSQQSNSQPSCSAPPPRKRVKPKRNTGNTENTSHNNQPSCSTSTAPKRCGRPRKTALNTENTTVRVNLNQPSCSSSSTTSSTSSTPKRPVGRPRKNVDRIMSPIRNTSLPERQPSKRIIKGLKCSCNGC